MYWNMITHPFKIVQNPVLFVEFYVNNFVKFSSGLIFKKNIYLKMSELRQKSMNRKYVLNNTFNILIQNSILNNKPFFSCRYGNSELTACFVYELRKMNYIDNISDKFLQTAKMGPGVFPMKEEIYINFAQVYEESLKHADFNAYWGTVLMEEYLCKKLLNKSCIQMSMRSLEPFEYEHPWTKALEGKKVLIVSPFAELIQEQYKKREKLFNNPEMLPEFELHTVLAVQSSGNTIPDKYANWCEALEKMYQSCMAEDFEVALLGCGSYAVPLGAKLKQSGKKAIVLGGMLQLMFGIKGKRWEESRPDIVNLYNENWIRAGEKFIVKDSDKMVDGAAYW